MPTVKFENVTYIYDKKIKALDNINIEIEQGEFIAVVGNTGSGKSTLIQHLNGLLLPSFRNSTYKFY